VAGVRGTLDEAWDEITRLRAELDRLRIGSARAPHLMLGQFTCPASPGEHEIVDLEFTPRAAWFMVAGAIASDAMHNGWGFAADTDSNEGVIQFSQSIRGVEGDVSSMARNRNNSDAISLCDQTGNPATLRGQVVSFDGSGITIDFIVASAAYDVYWMLMG
jgi:hypothetical protein